MICLSRPDESAFRHLKWNQSPAPLAPRNTTCQDLNGICNLREHVEADQDDGSGAGRGDHSAGAGDEKCRPGASFEEPHGALTTSAGRLSSRSGPSSCLKAVHGGEGHGRLFARDVSFSCNSHVWTWTAWGFSVLIVSSLLSFGKPLLRTMVFSSSSFPATESPATLAKLSAAPLVKKSTCASAVVDEDVYNTPLHVGALFIILSVSTLACAFSIMAKKFPGLRIPGRFFFAVRHFGTGVLIATAFVHLLPTAFISLGDPCLGDFWVEDYPAMPGAIALAAIFFVVVVEMVFHPSRHIRPVLQNVSSSGQDQSLQQGLAENDLPHHGCMGSANTFPIRDMGPLRGKASSIGQGLSNLDTAGREMIRCDNETSRSQSHRKNENLADEALSMNHLTPEQKHRKELLQCVLLELGILFHSVFIGMTLSVSIGNEFVILLIAIVFHQTFEGLALGSRIAAINWPQGATQPWLMALAYGCTTPAGQAIGLATHTLYSPDSEVGLIVVGVMNAISAGLLAFASLVELLSEDFLSDESWRFLQGKRRVCACLLVFAGAFLMSLVGAWA